MPRRRRAPTPMDFWVTGFEAARLGLEANTVIALRTMGMAGLWAMKPAETLRMVAEKQAAFPASATAAGEALAKGHGPLDVARAAMRPLQAKTGPNARRLSRAATRRAP